MGVHLRESLVRGLPRADLHLAVVIGHRQLRAEILSGTLIFGTIKATLYTMLFAVPLALLAAIYTSEFVHKSVRATVKPVMEMMASLPSVVLGFIAALILAALRRGVDFGSLVGFPNRAGMLADCGIRLAADTAPPVTEAGWLHKAVHDVRRYWPWHVAYRPGEPRIRSHFLWR